MNLVSNLSEQICHTIRVTYAFIHVVAVCRVWLFCNPMNCSLPCSSVHGISQSSILEWVVISLARDLTQDWTQVSRLAGDFFTTEPPGKPTFIQPTISTESLLGNVADSGAVTVIKRQNSVLLELKFSWRSWKASQCICNEIVVLIHAKEKSEAELEEELADGIINNGQYILIYYKVCKYWLI